MPGAEMLLKQAKPLLEKLPPKHSAWLAYYVADAPSLFSNKPEPERKWAWRHLNKELCYIEQANGSRQSKTSAKQFRSARNITTSNLKQRLY